MATRKTTKHTKAAEVRSEDAPSYSRSSAIEAGVMTDQESETVRAALEILRRTYEAKSAGPSVSSSRELIDYLKLSAGWLNHEVFGIVHLDARHRVICNEILSSGTLNGTAVYAREVVRAALKHNAAAVAFYHNHPSGVAEPSRADEALTQRLKEALSLVEIRVLDHIITGGDEHVSFAERGLL